MKPGAIQTSKLEARVSTSLADEIAVLAAANERSVSAEIRVALKAHVEANRPAQEQQAA